MTGGGAALSSPDRSDDGPDSAPDAVRFADIQRVLGVFAHGIAGRHLHMTAFEESAAEGRGRGFSANGVGIVLPTQVADFASTRHNRGAYRIAVLHQGSIVELGTHDELIARNGYYTDLYNKQLLEEELAEV